MRIGAFASFLAIGAALAVAGCNQQKPVTAEVKQEAPVATVVVVNESSLSPGMAQFRDRVLAVTDDAGIDTLLKEIETNYPNYSPDVKVLATLLLPLKAWKGAVWRGTSLLERTRVVNNSALATVRAVAAAQGILLPTDQWKASFDYLVKPAPDAGSQWLNISDFQAFLLKDVAPRLERMVTELKALEAATPRIVFDAKIFYGPASFQDNLDRFRVLEQAELRAIIAGAEAGLQGLYASCAYRMNEGPQLAERMGKVFGIDGWLDGRIDGFTSMQRSRIIRESQFNEMFRLAPEGRALLAQSFQHFKESVRYTRMSWDSARARPSDEFQLLKASLVNEFNRTGELSLKNLEAMAQGPTSVRSVVTGEVVTVDLPAFFNNPPADLKQLLPVGWIDNPERLTANGVSYRNPDFGAANSWNVESFKPYFPSVTNAQDLKAAARILSQSWAGGNMSLPLLAVLL